MFDIERQQLSQQQIQLFRHLSRILCRLAERISWTDLSPSEKRRLKRTIADIASCINAAKKEIVTKNHRQSKTTKATFRKR